MDHPREAFRRHLDMRKDLGWEQPLERTVINHVTKRSSKEGPKVPEKWLTRALWCVVGGRSRLERAKCGTVSPYPQPASVPSTPNLDPPSHYMLKVRAKDAAPSSSPSFTILILCFQKPFSFLFFLL